MYIYCTKNGGNLVYGTEYRGGSFVDEYGITRGYSKQKANEIFGLLNGKVVARFWCDKVEEIKSLKHKPSLSCPYDWLYYIVNDSPDNLKKNSCLGFNELHTYLQGKKGYAIHITKLEIFDKPKEISEFKRYINDSDCKKCAYGSRCPLYPCDKIPLTRAPESWCYVEV